MRKFDTKVQYIKYKVLREVARQAWNDTLLDNVMSIPRELAPRNAETIYCCVYKERAILSERVRMAMGGNRQNPNVIEVIDIACDECPMGGYEVTNSCRGCLARRCEDVCPKGATIMWPISISRSVWTAAPAPGSVLIPRLWIASAPAKTPAKSRPSP